MENLDEQEYMENVIKPIMENLVFQLISDRPENLNEYMMDWLKITGGYSNRNLTPDETKELEGLRKDIIIERERIDINFESTGDMSFFNLTKKPSTIKYTQEVQEEIIHKFSQVNFKARYVKKSTEQIIRLQGLISQVFLFRSLNQIEIDLIIGALEEKLVDANETIIYQGENGDSMYIVESGIIECYKKYDKNLKVERKYTATDSFGESTLLNGLPRAATLVAKTSCILWELDRNTFNHMLKKNVKKKRADYIPFLRSVELLKRFDGYMLERICDAMRPCYFNKDEYIIDEV
jgi:hypothetical protein